MSFSKNLYIKTIISKKTFTLILSQFYYHGYHNNEHVYLCHNKNHPQHNDLRYTQYGYGIISI